MEIIIMMMKGIIIILLFYMQPSLRQKTYCIDTGVVQKTSKQASGRAITVRNSETSRNDISLHLTSASFWRIASSRLLAVIWLSSHDKKRGRSECLCFTSYSFNYLEEIKTIIWNKRNVWRCEEMLGPFQFKCQLLNHSYWSVQGQGP